MIEKLKPAYEGLGSAKKKGRKKTVSHVDVQLVGCLVFCQRAKKANLYISLCARLVAVLQAVRHSPDIDCFVYLSVSLFFSVERWQTRREHRDSGNGGLAGNAGETSAADPQPGFALEEFRDCSARCAWSSQDSLFLPRETKKKFTPLQASTPPPSPRTMYMPFT